MAHLVSLDAQPFGVSAHPHTHVRSVTTVADVVVIGAGAIGVSAAYHLAQAGARVLVLEKESGPACHQSGRNSGVIHAGYNLKPGSLKAKYCIEGSRRLRAYCQERGIAMDQGGILVLARTERERAVLAELERRGTASGVATRLVDGHELAEIEPCAQGLQGLHAPEGASFDAVAYVRTLARDAIAQGAKIRYDTRVLTLEPAAARIRTTVRLRTTQGPVEARLILNCAGLHADRIAPEIARDVRIIPFRGYYAELRPDRRSVVRSHIYAAPDLEFPFLGVHFSRRVDGRVIVGPGAMLAFGREAYHFARVQPRDLIGILAWPGFYRLVTRPPFLKLIRSEVMKSLSVRSIWAEARQLIPALQPPDLTRSYAGNRAQLVSREGDLVDDIVVRETDHAVHVLNAVSPGLTCSLPFGEALAARCQAKLDGSVPHQLLSGRPGRESSEEPRRDA